MSFPFLMTFNFLIIRLYDTFFRGDLISREKNLWQHNLWLPRQKFIFFRLRKILNIFHDVWLWRNDHNAKVRRLALKYFVKCVMNDLYFRCL